MMRALWTAASGMITQQTNVDNISNNIANVNTTGFKKGEAEFKSLLYQNLQTQSTNSDNVLKPVNAQVGLGVRTAAITTVFTQGSLFENEYNLAFAIEGEGFFKIRNHNGETLYTRSASFIVSPVGENEDGMLCTSDGMPVLDVNDQAIIIPKEYNAMEVAVDFDGKFSARDKDGNPVDLGIQFGLVQFNNPSGLEKVSGSNFKVTPASGNPMAEITTQGLSRSRVCQNYLEGSNVQVVDEMVNLIVAQRAYEMNSKAITTADTMLEQANNLKR